MIITNELPSARGMPVSCKPDWIRAGLSRCSWEGLPPNVAPGGKEEWVTFTAARTGRGKAEIRVVARESRNCKVLFDRPVLGLKVDAVSGSSELGGMVEVDSHQQQQHPPHHYPGHYPPGEGPHTPDESLTERKPPYEERSPIYPGGTTELRLWSRDWARGWKVDVSWDANADAEAGAEGGDKLTGKIVCLWADVNDKGTVPAWDEVFQFVPKWAVGSKLSDGLVEGWWGFEV